MTTLSPKLGPLRCATITCRSVEQATATYTQYLGYTVVTRGRISRARAESWGAPKCEGAAFALLGPATGETTYIRFVEDVDAAPATPYSTLGWAALEFSVQSSDKALENLANGGFKIIGPAQDLDFCQGALRAGQVEGPFGEILYLTQINAQVEHYVLPTAATLVDRMFIVILGVSSVDDAYRLYSEQFGMGLQETFTAEVPFIADFQGQPKDTSYYVGCLALAPKSYIEVDQMMAGARPRPVRAGYLPSGIAMVTVEAPSLEPFAGTARGQAEPDEDPVYGGRKSLTVVGPNGELLEIVESAAID